MAIITLPGIRLDEAGVAWIDGSATKVIEVVLNKQWSGQSPEELQPNMPHLSLSQIYVALAYYHTHKEELDAEIERRRAWAEEKRAEENDPLSREELLARLRGPG